MLNLFSFFYRHWLRSVSLVAFRAITVQLINSMRLSGTCCLRRTCIMPAYRLNVHKHIRRAYVGVQFLYIRKCSMVEIKQEPHLMLTNPSDAFRGQSRSPIIEPFHMLGIVSSCAIVTLSLRRSVFPIFDFKNIETLKLGSEVTQGHRK